MKLFNKENMTRQKSLYYPGMYDFLEGILVASIILAHAEGECGIQASAEHSFLYNFVFLFSDRIIFLGTLLTPIFFIIAGIGFRKMPFRKTLKKQAKQLLLPYAFTALAVTVITLFARTILYRNLRGGIIASRDVFLSYLAGVSCTQVYFGHTFYFVGSVWFLLTMFNAWMLLNLIVNYVPEKAVPWTVLACMLIGFGIGCIHNLPYCIIQGLICSGYLYLGWYIGQRKLFSEKIPVWGWVLCAVLWLITQSVGQYYLYDCTWKLYLIDIFGTAIVSYAVIWLFIRINWLNLRIMSWFRVLGKYSLWIICADAVQMVGLPWYYLTEKWTGSAELYFVLILLSRCLIITVIVLIIKAVSKKLNAIKRAKKKKARQSRNV